MLWSSRQRGRSLANIIAYMPRYKLEQLPWERLILRLLSPDEPLKTCSTCDQPAIQQLNVCGLALTYFLCLKHAIAREA